MINIQAANLDLPKRLPALTTLNLAVLLNISN